MRYAHLAPEDAQAGVRALELKNQGGNFNAEGESKIQHAVTYIGK